MLLNAQHDISLTNSRFVARGIFQGSPAPAEVRASSPRAFLELRRATSYGQSPYSSSGLQGARLKQNLSFEGWNSRPMGNFRKVLSQAILVGIVLVGRFGRTRMMSKLSTLFFALRKWARRRTSRRRENLVGVNMAFHGAICELFEGATLEPCLLKPCFHVAGQETCSRTWTPDASETRTTPD